MANPSLTMSHDFLSKTEFPTCTRDFKLTLVSARVLLGRIHIVLSLPPGKSSSRLYIFIGAM